MVRPIKRLGGRQLLVSSVLWPEAIRDAHGSCKLMAFKPSSSVRTSPIIVLRPHKLVYVAGCRHPVAQQLTHRFASAASGLHRIAKISPTRGCGRGGLTRAGGPSAQASRPPVWTMWCGEGRLFWPDPTPPWNGHHHRCPSSSCGGSGSARVRASTSRWLLVICWSSSWHQSSASRRSRALRPERGMGAYPLRVTRCQQAQGLGRSVWSSLDQHLLPLLRRWGQG